MYMYIVYRDSNGIHMYMYMYLAFYGKQVFHLLVSFLFWMHTAYFILYSKEYIAGGYLFTDLLSLCHVVGILLCTLYNVCTPLALLQLLVIGILVHLKIDCLRLFVVVNEKSFNLKEGI